MSSWVAVLKERFTEVPNEAERGVLYLLARSRVGMVSIACRLMLSNLDSSCFATTFTMYG
ncbi:hypothetical protein DPMN_035182 [Dreissena polymorpha]|uniref:Uncharacterized protein n=1 Tax=Dreissena polymorpha TaxID=45954 RepID=A0A9D4RMN4_DREPO|nr:hypothetical protein DPMN_035182 [Dreissena polymorpha]